MINKEIDVETNVGSWFTMRIQPYRTLENVIEGAVITFVDISRTKKIENQYIASENRYRSLFNSMSEGLQILELIYDKNGKPIDYYYRDVNPSYEELVGKNREQLLNRRFKDIFPVVDENFIDKYDKVSKTGDSVSFEDYSAVMKRYYQINAWKTENDLVAVSFYDLTKQKLIEAELEKNKG